MNLTKRTTKLLVVFCVGLIALAADRTILRPQGGPRAASADSGSAASGLLAGNLPVLEDKPQETGVAQRLGSLWSGKEPAFETMRNPFALPATWFGTTNALGEPIATVVARFIRTHQLTAIVVNGKTTCVLVNDHFLVPGQTLDGFTLISAGDRSAVFECEGQQAILELIGR